MKNVTLMAALIAAGSMSVEAQTISSSWVAAPGSMHSYYYTDMHNAVGFGNAGSGQDWNFAAATSDSVYIESIVLPASAVGASNFPTATSASASSLGEAEMGSFYETSASVHQSLGYYVTGSGTNLSVIYSNPVDVLRFPVGFGQAFTDDFASTIDAGISYQRNGSISVDVDGSGTLTTAAGTYNGVFRVKTIETYQLIGLPPIPGASTSGTITSYNFISPDHAGIILYSYVISDDGINADTSISFGDPFVVGIAPRQASTELNVYPNPANQVINVATNHNIASIEVIDVQGRVVATESVTKNQSIVSIPTSNLSNGVYMVRATSIEGNSSVRRISVAH